MQTEVYDPGQPAIWLKSQQISCAVNQSGNCVSSEYSANSENLFWLLLRSRSRRIQKDDKGQITDRSCKIRKCSPCHFGGGHKLDLSFLELICDSPNNLIWSIESKYIISRRWRFQIIFFVHENIVLKSETNHIHWCKQLFLLGKINKITVR